MMRALVREATGRVENMVVVADGALPPEGYEYIEPTPGVQIGWLWDGVAFAPDPELEAVAEERRRAAAAAGAVALLAERLAKAEALRLVLAGEVSEEDADAISALFPAWAVGIAYPLGSIVEFEGSVYVIVQAHTSQEGWEPPVVPALWTRYTPPGQVDAWVQPTGAQDAYALGARVTHAGHLWESTVEANVWEPGVFGWTDLGEV
jgi:hypothetical protein